LVAIDAKTGKYLWHFQTIHHDIWDDDIPGTPTLLEVKRDGKIISGGRGDQQDGDPVYPRPRDRQAAF